MEYPQKNTTVTIAGSDLLAQTNGNANDSLVIDKAIVSNKLTSSSTPLDQTTEDEFANPWVVKIDTVKHQQNTMQPEVTFHNDNLAEDYPMWMIGLLAHAQSDKSGNETLYAVAEADDDPFIMPHRTDNDFDFTLAIPIGISNSDDVHIVTTEAGSVSNQDIKSFQDDVESSLSNIKSTVNKDLSTIPSLNSSTLSLNTNTSSLNASVASLSNNANSLQQQVTSNENNILSKIKGLNLSQHYQQIPDGDDLNNSKYWNDGFYYGSPNVNNSGNSPFFMVCLGIPEHKIQLMFSCSEDSNSIACFFRGWNGIGGPGIWNHIPSEDEIEGLQNQINSLKK